MSVQKPATGKDVSRTDARRPISANRYPAVEISVATGAEPHIFNRHDWLETMMDHVPDYIYAKDVHGRFLIANMATVVDSGFATLDELIGKTDFDIHPPEAARGFSAAEQRIVETGEPMFDMEERAAAFNGPERWLMTSKVPLRDKHGVTIGIVGASRDITDRKHSEQLLIDQARLLEMIAQGAPLAAFFKQLVLLIELHMPGIKGSFLTLSDDRAHPLTCAAPSFDAAYDAAIQSTAITPTVGPCVASALAGTQILVPDVHADPYWADYATLVQSFGITSCWATPVLSGQGQVLGTFALYGATAGLPTEKQQNLIRMGTHLAGIAIERQQSEERIHHLAHHDVLTGLPNRALFDQQIEAAMAAANKTGQSLWLAFLDIDHFKLINDSLGHKTGDELLKVVAERMGACVRKGDMVVRVGGDEFIVLLTGIPPECPKVLHRLEDIRTTLAAPMTIDGTSLQVTCSMGVASYPDHGRTAVDLLANADTAMYRAKAFGRNTLTLFQHEMSADAREHLARHEELRTAIAENQFTLHYQPQINLSTGKMFGCEALLRWNHPLRGGISPCDFIPLAEDTGLIVPIGAWVLNAACRQNKAWQDAGLPKIVVSVNVSARQFREKNWIQCVADALYDSGLEARYLELEITESLIMQDVSKAIETMHALEALGVTLAIDDFGTGYSSLSALKSFPVGRLKIDRSFVKDIPGDEDDMAITAAIVSLAQKLHLHVIAEGVETPEQAAFLRQIGCEEIQGYIVSRPVAAPEFARLMAS